MRPLVVLWVTRRSDWALMPVRKARVVRRGWGRVLMRECTLREVSKRPAREGSIRAMSVRPVVLGKPNAVRRQASRLVLVNKVLGVRKRAVAAAPPCRILAMPMRPVESGKVPTLLAVAKARGVRR